MVLRYLQVSVHPLGSYGLPLYKSIRSCVQDSFSVTKVPFRNNIIMARRSKLDMKSSQTVMKQRCRELGLVVYGDKQALLARIVNEENRLTTDRQVKDSDTDQEMLCTFKGTESLPIMDNMPCQHRQAEITAETKGDFERCSELRQWYKNHSGECPRRNSGDKTERTLAQWLESKKARRARALNTKPKPRISICMAQLSGSRSEIT